MSSVVTWLLETLAGRLVTAGVFTFGGWLLHDVVPRIIRRIAYQGENIAGEWLTNFTVGELEGKERIRLRQEGHRISGEIHTVHGMPGEEPDWLDSKVVGEFRGDNFTAYYTPTNQRRFGSGSFTLRLTKGGKRLEGRCILQLTKDRSLREIDYVWNRAGA